MFIPMVFKKKETYNRSRHWSLDPKYFLMYKDKTRLYFSMKIQMKWKPSLMSEKNLVSQCLLVLKCSRLFALIACCLCEILRLHAPLTKKQCINQESVQLWQWVVLFLLICKNMQTVEWQWVCFFLWVKWSLLGRFVICEPRPEALLVAKERTDLHTTFEKQRLGEGISGERMIEWFGLEGTLQITKFQSPN